MCVVKKSIRHFFFDTNLSTREIIACTSVFLSTACYFAWTKYVFVQGCTGRCIALVIVKLLRMIACLFGWLIELCNSHQGFVHINIVQRLQLLMILTDSPGYMYSGSNWRTRRWIPANCVSSSLDVSVYIIIWSYDWGIRRLDVLVEFKDERNQYLNMCSSM